MTLENQLVPIVIGKGLNTKTNDKVGAPGELSLLSNAIFKNPGKIQKRNGYSDFSSSIVGGGSVSSGALLMSHRDELLLDSGNSLYGFSDDENAWSYKGNTILTSVSITSAIRSEESASRYDSSVIGGIALVSSVKRYCIIDISTGTILFESGAVLPGATTKVLNDGASFFILSTDNAKIYCTTVAPSNPFSASTVTVASDYSGLLVNIFDAAILGGKICVVYPNNTAVAGVHGITILKADKASPSTISYSRSIPGYNVICVCVFEDSNSGNIAVGWSVTGGAFFSELTPTLGLTSISEVEILSTLSTSQINAMCGAYSADDNGIVFYMDSVASAPPDFATDFIYKSLLQAPFTTATTSVFARSVSIAGKPFLSTGGICLPVSFMPGDGDSVFGNYVVDTISCYFVLDKNGNAIAKSLPGDYSGYYNAGWTSSPYGHMVPESNYMGTTLIVALGKVDEFSSNSFFGFPVTGRIFQHSALVLASIELSPSEIKRQYSELALSTELSGSIVRLYDGNGIAELGFYYPPFGLQFSLGSTGAYVGAGTYQYTACYEWTDHNGLIHRSAPALPIDVTVVTPGEVDIKIPTLRVTSKTTGYIKITIYRTLANQTVFHELTQSIVQPSIYNDKTIDFVTWKDFQPDADIESNKQLYTTGGVLQNDTPPSFSDITVNRNRLVGVDSEEELSIWYSKQTSPGVPVEFSSFLTLNEDPRGGRVTAISSLDDKLVVFKSDKVFIHTGQGPDSTGAQNDFSDSILVSSDVGCAVQKSIIVTPIGLMFQSSKGIYLLDRGLNCSYIGAPVEIYNSDTITSAVLSTETNQIRFAQSERTLVYDYLLSQWSVFTLPSVSAIEWGGKYTKLASSGIVSQETAAYSDEVDFIEMSMTTQWISLAGIQGFKRVRKILLEGKASAPVGITVDIFIDFDDTAPVQTVTFQVSASNWQERIFMVRQKCESIRVRFRDASIGSNDVYNDLTAITLEVAAKRGAFKLPSARSAG